MNYTVYTQVSVDSYGGVWIPASEYHRVGDVLSAPPKRYVVHRSFEEALKIAYKRQEQGVFRSNKIKIEGIGEAVDILA